MEINALIVDDSGIMRKLVMRSLLQSKLAQFMFVEAKDGLDALTKFNPETTEMIFVDWNMPNMNGLDFVKKVREIQTRHVPVVMVTTEGTMGKVEEALNDAKVDCFVVKPFTPEVLQKKLTPLFDKLSQEATAAAAPKGFFSKLAAKLE